MSMDRTDSYLIEQNKDKLYDNDMLPKAQNMKFCLVFASSFTFS